MRSELGLVNMDILWSGALLVPVIAMLATTRPKERNPEAMLGWLALAALLHRYSGSSETALDQDLKACRADDPIGALLKNLRQHRGSLLQGRTTSPEQSTTEVVCSRHTLPASIEGSRTSSPVRMWCYTRTSTVTTSSRGDSSLRRSARDADKVANIAFITSDVNKAISHSGPEVYLNEIKPAILESQCVPLDAALWRIRDADAFFMERRKLLAESFNDFLRVRCQVGGSDSQITYRARRVRCDPGLPPGQRRFEHKRVELLVWGNLIVAWTIGHPAKPHVLPLPLM